MPKFLIGIVAMTLLLSGCSDPGSTNVPTKSPSPTTSTMPSRMTEAEARSLAEKMLNDGEEITGASYNQFSRTWWFDLNITRSGCFPALVVYEMTGKVETNPRCTGALPPMNSK